MKLTFSEIVALVLGIMIGLRMLIMLIRPRAHRPLAINLYNKRMLTTKRIFYALVAFLCTYLLIKDTSIVYFVLAVFAIGAIFDIYFTTFQFPEPAEAEELVKAGKPVPFYISASSSRNLIQGLAIIALVVWMYVDIFFIAK